MLRFILLVALALIVLDLVLPFLIMIVAAIIGGIVNVFKGHN